MARLLNAIIEKGRQEAGAAATARAVEGQRIELPVASVCRTASAGGGGGE